MNLLDSQAVFWTGFWRSFLHFLPSVVHCFLHEVFSCTSVFRLPSSIRAVAFRLLPYNRIRFIARSLYRMRSVPCIVFHGCLSCYIQGDDPWNAFSTSDGLRGHIAVQPLPDTICGGTGETSCGRLACALHPPSVSWQSNGGPIANVYSLRTIGCTRPPSSPCYGHRWEPRLSIGQAHCSIGQAHCQQPIFPSLAYMLYNRAVTPKIRCNKVLQTLFFYRFSINQCMIWLRKWINFRNIHENEWKGTFWEIMGAAIF